MTSLRHFFIALAMLTLCASAVYPCTCVENSARSDFRRAKAIFVGEVVSTQDGASGVKINFKVEKQWKGNQVKEFTALWEGPGPCGGFLFEKGLTYLVYARGNKMFVYSGCDRTARIDHAQDNIRKLNSAWFRFYARLIPF